MIKIVPSHKKLNIKTEVPSSKSYTNRALLLAALAKGKSVIYNPLLSDDTVVMIETLKRLGVGVQKNSSSIIIEGVGGKFGKINRPLYLGNAGTAVRFLTAALASQANEYTITGNERMQMRPIADLTDALDGWGVEVKFLNENGCPPLTICGPLEGETTSVVGSISSQYISALLMIAPYANAPAVIRVQGKLTSPPYIKMTLDTIKTFGGYIQNINNKKFKTDPHIYKGTEYFVEGDASSASYPLAIAALNCGSAEIINVPADSAQADLAFIKILKKMGCIVNKTKYENSSSEQKSLPLNAKSTPNSSKNININEYYRIEGPSKLKPLGKIDLNKMPDAAMTVAILCAFADGKSILTGLGNLKVKETDRITALKNELRKIGANVKTGKTYIEIDGDPTGLHGAEIETYDDHRMAMCFTVAGTKISDIIIKDPDCVKKTYPNFFQDLKKWGIRTKNA